mgnify:CR=1 FL=1
MIDFDLYKFVKDISHEENAVNVCKYVLNYIRNRQKIIELNDSFENRMALLEEYREWINDGLSKQTVLLLREDPII